MRNQKQERPERFDEAHLRLRPPARRRPAPISQPSQRPRRPEDPHSISELFSNFSNCERTASAPSLTLSKDSLSSDLSNVSSSLYFHLQRPPATSLARRRRAMLSLIRSSSLAKKLDLSEIPISSKRRSFSLVSSTLLPPLCEPLCGSGSRPFDIKLAGLILPLIPVTQSSKRSLSITPNHRKDPPSSPSSPVVFPDFDPFSRFHSSDSPDVSESKTVPPVSSIYQEIPTKPPPFRPPPPPDPNKKVGPPPRRVSPPPHQHIPVRQLSSDGWIHTKQFFAIRSAQERKEKIARGEDTASSREKKARLVANDKKWVRRS